jgi:hypothetical protein
MHASYRIINVNQREYIQVITHEKNRFGQSRVKILKSFGLNIPANLIGAKIFIANFNILENLKTDSEVTAKTGQEVIKKVGGARVGDILGWEIIAYLFKPEKK